MQFPENPGNQAADPFDLQRFITAQEGVCQVALDELKSGHKRSHWIWFIFPQIDGLSPSRTSRFYAIKSLEEARGYLLHPLLGPRLEECTATVLDLEGYTVSQIFGCPDELKFRSCMTLFAQVAGPDNSLFQDAIEKYYRGQQDFRTLDLLDAMCGG